jgi:hypothetical protein
VAGPSASNLAWAALGFGLAALVAAWNPVSAPFGLAVGLAAAGLALTALRRRHRPRVAGLGLLAGLSAAALAVTVLALTAGVGRDDGGAALVPRPKAADVASALDAAATTTRPARSRAEGELDALRKQAP